MNNKLVFILIIVEIFSFASQDLISGLDSVNSWNTFSNAIENIEKYEARYPNVTRHLVSEVKCFVKLAENCHDKAIESI